jgi:hypothetical protein
MENTFPDVVDRVDKRAQHDFKLACPKDGEAPAEQRIYDFTIRKKSSDQATLVEQIPAAKISNDVTTVSTEREARGWNRHHNVRGSQSKKHKYADPRLEAYMASR